MSQYHGQSNSAALPPGMHTRAATMAYNPGQLASPAFGPSRVALVQPTLHQARTRAAVAAVPPSVVAPAAAPPAAGVHLALVAQQVPPPTPPRRFELATESDPILLSPVKPKMRSLHLTHVDISAD